ncbi:flavin containing amine oxidoreductase domain-containing protein [Phthorimaea operculella]|nr:flavin containing amine oxidoreductase domain-containing protein [Phthorimaea operculella]
MAVKTHHRRQFNMGWHGLSVVLIGLLFIVSLCNGNPVTLPEEYDTIVVGMGAAGAVAASTLARAGKRVLALEAQDRIGGRVYTVPFGDGIVEVGAEWIHGIEDSRTYRIAMENNITIVPQTLDFHLMKSDGTPAPKNINDLMSLAFDFLEDNAEKPEPLSDFITKKLMDHLNKNAPDVAQDQTLVKAILRYLSLMIEGYEAANCWKDLNARTTFISLEGHQHMSWHRNGYMTFFDLILNTYKGGSGLPNLVTKLNTEVTKIEWPQEANGKVSVTTKDGTIFRAENVIVTVSLGVLKERHQNLFSPSLPQDKVTAIDKLQMGVIGKIIFSFEKTWWPQKESYYGFLWSNDDLKAVPEEDYWTTTINGAGTPMGSTNTITMWTVGNTAKQVEVLPEETVKTKAMGVLRRFLRNITIPEPNGMLRTKWFSNEFTRGAYSYDSMVAADYPTARADLEAPLKDASGKPRVLFAGEAAHTTRFSTVHGAADTGHREAMRLLGGEQN